MQNETITSAYGCRKEEDMYVEKQLAVEPPYHFDQVLRRLSSDPLKAVDLSQREIKVPIRLEQNRTWSSFKLLEQRMRLCSGCDQTAQRNPFFLR